MQFYPAAGRSWKTKFGDRTFLRLPCDKRSLSLAAVGPPVQIGHRTIAECRDVRMSRSNVAVPSPGQRTSAQSNDANLKVWGNVLRLQLATYVSQDRNSKVSSRSSIHCCCWYCKLNATATPIGWPWPELMIWTEQCWTERPSCEDWWHRHDRMSSVRPSG